MSFRDLAQIQLQNLLGGPNQLAGRPVGLHTPPSVPPTVIPLVIDWGLYNPSFANREIGVRIDLSATNQAQPGLDKIRSVKIDNSYCSVPIYVQFSDTLDTVVCPAYSIIVTGVYTNALSCIVYGTEFFTGRPPQTTIEFCNFDRQGLVLSDLSADSAKMLYLTSGVDSTSANSFSFPITTPYDFPGDGIVVIAFAAVGSPSAAAMTAVTFNGVAMNGAASLTTNFACSRILYLSRPGLVAGTYTLAGTTNAATVTVTAQVFLMTNWTQATPFYDATTIQAVAVTAAALTASVAQPVPGGVGLFLEIENTATPDSPSWEGATKISTRNFGNLESSCAIEYFLDANPAAVSVNGNNVIGNLWI